jgi:hypothetical protein
MKLYYILMSQEEMFKNEVIEEILRERTNYYISKNKIIDFWLTLCPNFLNIEEIENTNFFKKEKLKKKSIDDKFFYSLLISSNKEFINWVQLRIGFFEKIGKMNEMNDIFKSNGIYGIYDYKVDKNLLPLSDSNFSLDVNILSDIYKKSLSFI